MRTVTIRLAIAVIGLLVASPAHGQTPTRPIETLPAARGGQDLVGTKAPRFAFDRTVARPGAAPKPPRRPPVATLYRWWTDRCGHCAASLPAIEALREKYRDRGLRVVAVYHPKPPRIVTDAEVIAAADALGYRGELAVDEDWSVLRSFYLDRGKRPATSASFLVDRNGVIRFVHPGPRFHPSTDPRSARENEDHRLVEAAIRALVGGG